MTCSQLAFGVDTFGLHYCCVYSEFQHILPWDMCHHTDHRLIHMLNDMLYFHKSDNNIIMHIFQCFAYLCQQFSVASSLASQVARHLAKLFDSMAKLKFQEEEEGKPTKVALGMWSKDGEYVDFHEPCHCVGQVEVWLNTLLETMQATIRHEFMEAVVAYEEKAREQWVFDPPAQVTA